MIQAVDTFGSHSQLLCPSFSSERSFEEDYESLLASDASQRPVRWKWVAFSGPALKRRVLLFATSCSKRCPSRRGPARPCHDRWVVLVLFWISGVLRSGLGAAKVQPLLKGATIHDIYHTYRGPYCVISSQLSLSSLSPVTNTERSDPCFAFSPSASCTLSSGESNVTPRIGRE